LENRYAAEQYERFNDLAAELVRLNVDVLVAVTRPSALAAQRATATIPIVFVVVPDPVGSKLVASLAHPGANITGLSNMALELSGKRLELLKEAVAGLSRVALLINPNDREGARRYAEESQAAARLLGLTLLPVEVRSPDDLDRAFSDMAENRAGGVVVPADGMFYNERRRITALALARRIPTMLYSKETVEAGGLMSYGPSHTAIFRRAAFYIDKILKGTKPADLPVELPTRFELIVSLKAAEALGLKIPQTLLARADAVIE
jgi:putative tryptophan/tyrosine transport system substrate-binding protein